MRLTAAGWARNHGATEIAEVNLTTVGIEGSIGPNHSLLVIDKNASEVWPSVKSVSLNCFANIRLGGDYLVKLTLEKEEIARLYYLTHKGEVDALVNSLPIQKG